MASNLSSNNRVHSWWNRSSKRFVSRCNRTHVSRPSRKSLLCKSRHGELAKHLRRHAFSVRRVPTSRRNPGSLFPRCPVPPPHLPSSPGISLTPSPPRARLLSCSRICTHARNVSFVLLCPQLRCLRRTMDELFSSTRKSNSFSISLHQRSILQRFPYALISLEHVCRGEK